MNRRPTITRALTRLALLVLLLPLLAVLGAQTAWAQGQECFSQTGFCIEGRFLEYWRSNGGLAAFGMPISAAQTETVEKQSLTVQWFERNRFELHPENRRPYDVLIGRVGAETLASQGRDWKSYPKEAPQIDCIFFESGFNVCEPFLSRYRLYGIEFDGQSGFSHRENLAFWGLPLSGVIQESLEERLYPTQWFERGRFELHEENQPPHNVLFGRLGATLKNWRPTLPAPEPTVVSEPPVKNYYLGVGRSVVIRRVADGWAFTVSNVNGYASYDPPQTPEDHTDVGSCTTKHVFPDTLWVWADTCSNNADLTIFYITGVYEIIE